MLVLVDLFSWAVTGLAAAKTHYLGIYPEIMVSVAIPLPVLLLLFEKKLKVIVMLETFPRLKNLPEWMQALVGHQVDYLCLKQNYTVCIVAGVNLSICFIIYSSIYEACIKPRLSLGQPQHCISLGTPFSLCQCNRAHGLWKGFVMPKYQYQAVCSALGVQTQIRYGPLSWGAPRLRRQTCDNKGNVLQVSCWKPVQIAVGPADAAANSIGHNYWGTGAWSGKA